MNSEDEKYERYELLHEKAEDLKKEIETEKEKYKRLKRDLSINTKL